jgi:hypothetical protein
LTAANKTYVAEQGSKIKSGDVFLIHPKDGVKYFVSYENGQVFYQSVQPGNGNPVWAKNNGLPVTLRKPLDGYAKWDEGIHTGENNNNVTLAEVEGIIKRKPTIKELFSTYHLYKQDTRNGIAYTIETDKAVSAW